MAVTQVDFDALPKGELESMLAAGEKVVESVRVLGNTGDNIVGELLRAVEPFYEKMMEKARVPDAVDDDVVAELVKTTETFYEWNHYPEGDVFDPRSNAQYYYHAHPAEERPGEHGHFHTFLRPKGMPPGIEPAPVPDYEAPKGDNDALSHLIAISCETSGKPIKLFTTNRWVTGEVWHSAADVNRMVSYFVIDHVRPSWAVNQWVSSMIVLFRPQIRDLIATRDRVVEEWAAEHQSDDVFEDRGLEVASECAISVPDQITAIRAALKKKATNGAGS